MTSSDHDLQNRINELAEDVWQAQNRGAVRQTFVAGLPTTKGELLADPDEAGDG